MSAPEDAAPRKRAARGTAASSELVEVYKILIEAGELTVPQIAERFPRPGFISAAMNAYREHKERTDPTWLDGKGERWGRPAQNEAMTWWVRRIVKQGVINKFFINSSSNPRNSRVDGTYIPGKTPMVRRIVVREEATLVPWSADAEAALNRGVSAGMEFVRLYDELRQSGKRLGKEVKDALDAAERAIRPKLNTGTIGESR